MQIKMRVICIQLVIISSLLAVIFSSPEKYELISPLAKQKLILAQNIKPSITAPSLTPTPTATPTPTLTPTPTPTPLTYQELENLFSKYSDKFSVAKDLLKKIASCESGFNPNAVSGNYMGMFQFSPNTWITNRMLLGENINIDLRIDPEESIKTAAFMISRHITNAWPHCSK